jgi:hypothetical protein
LISGVSSSFLSEQHEKALAQGSESYWSSSDSSSSCLLIRPHEKLPLTVKAGLLQATSRFSTTLS